MNADEYGRKKQLQMQMISVVQSKDRKVKMDMDMHSSIHEGENFKDMNLLDECGWICGAKKHLVMRTTSAVFYFSFLFLVKNTARSFGEIQFTIFEIYSD